MKKLIVCFLLAFPFLLIAQNNPVFVGGNGAGWSANSVAQAGNNIYTGGNSAGWSGNGVAQTGNNIYTGGNGSGWSTNGVAQTSNNIFTGGNGDGWSTNSVAQTGNNIFTGGNCDGWASDKIGLPPVPVIPPTCALNLTGVAGAGVQITNNAALNLTTTYTYEAWIKPSTDITNYRTIVSRDAAANTPTIYVASSADANAGKILVQCVIGAVQRNLYGSIAHNDNQWHHIATTYDGANMVLYVDGIFENALVVTGSVAGTATALGIGYHFAAGNYPFIGKIDEVRIWNTARSYNQIIAAMNTSLAGNEAGLIAYYDFNNGTYNGNGQTVSNMCTTTSTILNGLTYGTATLPTFDCPNTVLPIFVAPTCAAKFNGTNSYVNVVNTPTTMPNKGTIEFWMNQPSFSNWQIPFSTFDPNVTPGTFTDGMYFQTYADGSLYFIYASSYTVYGIELFGALSINRNYHLAVSWDLTSQTIKGYLDGKLIFNKALTTTFPTSIPRLTLAGGFQSGRFYNGTLDEVRYWNVERTQNQLISKASDSLVGNEVGLKAYYRFNDNTINGSGQTITNYATATGATLNGTTVNYVKFPCTVNPPTCGITLSGAAGEGVQVPNNAAFNSTTNITYEAWVKPSTNVAISRRIVGKGGNGTQEAPGIYVQAGTGKVTAGMLINGTQQIVTSALAINDNEWHHTALTYDGTTLKLYVDVQ
jgi:hypothetical protein